jgi:hypothetical protein
MTITVDLKPEAERALAAQASSRGMDVPTYATSLLEEAAQPQTPKTQDETGSRNHRPPGQKSLAELFAESPLKGLDLDFSRNRLFARPVDL